MAGLRGGQLPAGDDVGPTVTPSSSFSPIAGPSGNNTDSEKALTAAQIKLQERTQRLAGKKPSTSTTRKKKSGPRRTKAKNETPSSSATRDEPIQKGKSFKTRAEPKEKDPESEEVKNQKFVFCTKNGGGSKNGEFVFFLKKSFNIICSV